MLRIILSSALLLAVHACAKEWNDLLPEFEAYAEKSMAENQAVGMAVAIVKEGKIIYAKGFGKQGLNNPRPVTLDSLFQIGSMSKSFTTAIAALAVDRKQMKWEDPVINYVPSFVLYDPWVTRAFHVEDLFAQRSGLTQRAGDFQVLLGVTVDAMIQNLRYYQPVTSFRSDFAYQNIFFLVGAEAIAKGTGKTWHQLINSEFFMPLGMKSSSADLASYLKSPNRVTWHVRNPDSTVDVIPESIATADWPYIYYAAGGINSTISDMAQWIIMQTDVGQYRGKQIVSRENLQRTHRSHIYAQQRYNATNYYCLGWGSMDYSPYPILWHNGATSDVNNNMAIIPEERLGIVVLCNTRGTIVAEALTLKFFDLYFDKPEYDWTLNLMNEQKVSQPSPITPTPLPSLPLEEYCGTYFNPVYKKIVVTTQGNALQATIGPKQTKWTLKHADRDSFALFWPSVDEGTTKVHFCTDAENKPNTLIVEMFESENMGVFTRLK